MIRTNVMKKTTTIKFKTVAPGKEAYLNESFEYIEHPVLGSYFIDWIEGGRKSTSDIGLFDKSENNWDVEFLGKRFTTDLKSYVEQKIIQKLQIHQNEFNYKHENTESVGIPYLDKLTASELDLFIKEALLSVVGVKEITKFISSVSKEAVSKYGNDKLQYTAKFEVKTVTGENIWQSIVI